MPAGDGVAPVVFVDEWHVRLYASGDPDEAVVEDLRERVDSTLRRWASEHELPGASFALLVEQ